MNAIENPQNSVTITVDGKQIECRPGEYVIQAAKRAGIYVPHFCWHPRMDPIGACRMCLVHIEGAPPKPQTSCTTPVADGMVVSTQFTNPEIREAQEGVLEFLLINHPLDCPICDRGGECPLQDQTQDYGPDDSRFIEAKRRFRKPIPISPAVNLDRERCILCFRCTRFCDELSGDRLIATMERGAGSYIYPFEDSEFDSYFSVNTIEICPVGALTASEYRFKARPWDLNLTRSVCNLCASGCNVNLGVRVADGALVRASQATNEDVNEEWLCDKGRFGQAYVSGPERITTPWIRTDSGLVEATWEEAIGEICKRLGGVVEKAAPDSTESVAMFAGAALCNEDAYAASKFARVVLRTNSVASSFFDIDPVLESSVTYEEILGASKLFLVGIDAREELPMLFLRARIAHFKRGLEVFVVHPRRSAAEFAEWLAVDPGSYDVVPDAVAQAIDSSSVIVIGDSVARQPNATKTWRDFVATKPGVRLSWGFRSAGTLSALQAGLDPRLLPIARDARSPQSRQAVEDVWGTGLPTSPGANGAEILKRAAAGALDGLWIAGIDLLDAPGADVGRNALTGAKFVVLQTPVAEPQINFADVILPAATFAEREGTVTNFESRAQTFTAAVSSPGSSQPDHAIFDAIARRMGRPIGCEGIQGIRKEILSLQSDSRIEIESAAPGSPKDGLRLVSYPLLYDDGTRISQTESIAKMTRAAFVEISEADSGEIEDGDKVIVSTSFGSVVVEAKITKDLKPGAVFVPWSQPGAPGRSLVSTEDLNPSVSLERA